MGKEYAFMDRDREEQSLTNDEKIIDMYWQRNPDAIQETACRYGSLVRKVAYNILSDDQDCEECQNDTYLKIWNAIPTARPPAFSAFIIRVVRQIAIKRYIEKTRKKRIPSQLTISLEELNTISNDPSVEEVWEAKELGRMITEYVKQLNERQRYIFIDHFYSAEPVEKTAAELSISERMVYHEIKKIKKSLREYLERNGVPV